MTWQEMAGAQHGVVTTSQLHKSGLGYEAIEALVKEGKAERVGPRILVMAGVPVDWRCRLWIGVLSAGPGAFLWRRSAAALWELDGVESAGLDDQMVEVAVRDGRHRSGVRRFSTLGPGDLVHRDGLRLTGPARTVCDLGSALDADIVERAVECALRRRLVSARGLIEYSESQRTPGSRTLRRVLRRRPAGAVPTASDAETLFLQIARLHGLPEPERQVTVILRGRRYQIDFAWRSIRLAVEIDGATTHGPGQLTADLRRQNEIILDGWFVLRFSWEMVMHEPDYVGRRLLLAFGLCSLGPRSA